MNRADRARELLLKNLGKHVSKQMMSDAGVCEFYVVRNAVAEARPGLESDGYKLIAENAGAATCGYRLVKKPQDERIATEPAQISTNDTISGEAHNGPHSVAPGSSCLQEPSPYFDKKGQSVMDLGQ